MHPSMSEGSNLSSPQVEELAAPISHTHCHRHTHTGRRRTHRVEHWTHGSSRRGRLWLILIFFAMQGADAILYFGAPPSNRFHLLGSIITSTIWTTALLGGIWYRNNWCRYVLFFLLMFNVVLPVIQIYDVWLLRHIVNFTALYSIIAATVIFGGVAWTLIFSPDIKRLTSRIYN